MLLTDNTMIFSIMIIIMVFSIPRKICMIFVNNTVWPVQEKNKTDKFHMMSTISKKILTIEKKNADKIRAENDYILCCVYLQKVL